MKADNVAQQVNDKKPADAAKPRPILKWAGGKQQLLSELLEKVPEQYNKYIEPFMGGGALFFALAPGKAVISDSNPDLINVYRTVAHDVEGVIKHLKTYKVDKDSYYDIRAVDTSKMPDVQQAARTIYLNRTCFNGLYRVNRQGCFNVPYGHYKNPRVCREEELRAASAILKKAEILCLDYKKVLKKYAGEGDFIYIDPPYLPISEYSDFKRYTKEQFYEEDHFELAEEVKRLHELGCHIVLTNSNHPLVYELYEGFKFDVYQTRRNINKIGSKRAGEDVMISIPPRRKLSIEAAPPVLVEQVHKYPPTRYMGSKQAILPRIFEVADHLKYDSVLDLFSGSGVVSYMFKAYGKKVSSNDFMAMNAAYSLAMIENNHDVLTGPEIERLLDTGIKTDEFVSKTFKGLYFSDEDNHLIDSIRANIKKMKGGRFKKAIAMTALIRAAMKKRPRGIFTYTGDRYNDGRKDLKTSFREQFIQAAHAVNRAVFDNGHHNRSRCGDAMSAGLQMQADLVYMDPPYYSPYSDNDYVRRYHFLEGLARDWKGVEIQQHTKTKKFRSFPSPFCSRIGAHAAFDKLFAAFRHSKLLVSYSSNSLPTRQEILSLMAKYKTHVEAIAIDHRYSFANQGHKKENIKNNVQEFLFVGY